MKSKYRYEINNTKSSFFLTVEDFGPRVILLWLIFFNQFVVMMIHFFWFVGVSLVLFLVSNSAPSPVLQKTVRLINLASSLIPYDEKYQKALLNHHIDNQNREQECVGTLIILQHTPVFTFGTATEDQNTGSLKTTPSQTATTATNTNNKLEEEDDGLEYEVVTVERAGQGTFHGPGQLVLYPILDLNYFEKDINLYLRRLEQIVINTCGDHEVSAVRVDGLTGVWAGEGANSKVAAIGIKLRRWVTMHGVSVNVNPDLRYVNILIYPYIFFI